MANKIKLARGAMLIGAVAVFLALLFPPFVRVAPNGQVVERLGHGFLFSPPNQMASIDMPMLLIEWTAILLICGLIWLSSKAS